MQITCSTHGRCGIYPLAITALIVVAAFEVAGYSLITMRLSVLDTKLNVFPLVLLGLIFLFYWRQIRGFIQGFLKIRS